MDAADLFEYHSNSDVVRFIPWPRRDLESVTDYLKTALENRVETLQNEGDYLNLAWELKETGKVIGQSNLSLVSSLHQKAEFGYVAHQDFQRQGFANEASRAILDYAFSTGRVRRVVANIDSRAEASIELAKKLGLRLEGTFIGSQLFKGEWVDMHLFAITRAEFELIS